MPKFTIALDRSSEDFGRTRVMNGIEHGDDVGLKRSVLLHPVVPCLVNALRSRKWAPLGKAWASPMSWKPPSAALAPTCPECPPPKEIRSCEPRRPSTLEDTLRTPIVVHFVKAYSGLRDPNSCSPCTYAASVPAAYLR